MPYIGRNPDRSNFSDLNGDKLIIDADADTSIHASTDDQIDIEISGADDFRFTANNFNVLSGSTLTIDSGATIANSGTATGFSSADPASADGDSLGTASLEWSDLYLADGSIIYFGNDQEVTLSHNHNAGLVIKHTATGDNTPVQLLLQTGETDIAADDIIGRINFQAPDEGTGTDAILLAAAMLAVSEGDFSSSNNATSLKFFTGNSAQAGTDGGSLILGSTGNLTLKDLRTADGSSPTLTLQSGDTNMEANDILGKIAFQAPDEGTGTDAILVAAAIQAKSEGDFSSSSNATSLDFMVGSSEAAATKMTLNSSGNLSVGDGAVATPSYSNVGDLNTGIYFPGADEVGITAGGTEQFRFGSNSTASASKNVIINGSMQICQRATSTSGVGNGDSGYVGPDQWYFDEAGTVEGVITVSQETGGGVGGQDRWMKLLCTTEEALGGSTDQMQMMQRLEAQNCVPLKNGATGIAETTISADIIIHADGSSGLSFPVKVAFSVHTQDGTARQCIGDMSIAANDTWERVSITLPSDATATFVSDNALGCTFNISLCGGSGRNATNLTWANEDSDFNTSSSDNIMDQANNYIGITRVQWEVGAIPTDFAYESVANILQKCQRYFYNTNLYEQSTRWGVGAYDATNGLGSRHTFPVQMRASPTAAFTSSAFLSAHSGTTHDSSITVHMVDDQFGYQPYISVQSSGDQGEWYWIADNGGNATTGAVTFTAEL